MHEIASIDRFIQAASLSFPVFYPNERGSTPLNSTPYVVRLHDFERISGTWPGRRDLVAHVSEVISRAEMLGVAVDFLLIGGSFTDMTNAAPRDMDAAWLYRVKDASTFDTASLRVLQAECKALRLDSRFIPADGDPLVLLKSVVFFSVLYSKKEGDARLTRGLLLVDCR